MKPKTRPETATTLPMPDETTLIPSLATEEELSTLRALNGELQVLRSRWMEFFPVLSAERLMQAHLALYANILLPRRLISSALSDV